MSGKEQLVVKIEDLMDRENLSLHERLEIIANILIREGLSTIPTEYLPEVITPENLMSTVLDLKDKYSETIGIATIHQGLVLLMWLEN